MKDYEGEFKELLRAINAGSQEAARKFLDDYGGYIITVIRRRLHRKLRSKFDSQDFLQDVCASFFREPPPPEAFSDTKSLLRYLAGMARGKVHATAQQRLGRQRFNVERERSLDGSAAAQAQRRAGADPSPSRVAGMRDELAVADKELSVPLRMTLRLLRAGYSNDEIAHYLNTTVRQVERNVRLLRERFQP